MDGNGVAKSVASRTMWLSFFSVPNLSWTLGGTVLIQVKNWYDRSEIKVKKIDHNE